jgi:hypothetical protein
MEHKKRLLWNRLFIAAFLVLTLFCWCPLGYGSYGDVNRILGVPAWVVWAFVIGIGLFVLEWVYLFQSRLTLTDKDLSDIVPELEAVDMDGPDGESEEG